MRTAWAYKQALDQGQVLMVIWPFDGCTYDDARGAQKLSGQYKMDAFRELFDLNDIGVDLQSTGQVQRGDVLALPHALPFEWETVTAAMEQGVSPNGARRLWPIQSGGWRFTGDAVFRTFFLKMAESVNQHIRDSVTSFVRQHRLDDFNLITVHVRQGNNEKGAFSENKRGNTVSDLVESVQKQIDRVVNSPAVADDGREWKVFVATDNVAVIETLRSLTEHEVISREQKRLEDGKGVLMGASGNHMPTDCVGVLFDALVDQQLMSLGQVLLIPARSKLNYLPQVVVSERGDILCGIQTALQQWECTKGDGFVSI